MKLVKFYIEDVEVDEVYFFITGFDDMDEVKDFIQENRKVGNTIKPIHMVTICNITYEEVAGKGEEFYNNYISKREGRK